jgi:hypothetical protein
MEEVERRPVEEEERPAHGGGAETGGGGAAIDGGKEGPTCGGAATGEGGLPEEEQQSKLYPRGDAAGSTLNHRVHSSGPGCGMEAFLRHLDSAGDGLMHSSPSATRPVSRSGTNEQIMHGHGFHPQPPAPALRRVFPSRGRLTGALPSPSPFGSLPFGMHRQIRVVADLLVSAAVHGPCSCPGASQSLPHLCFVSGW